MLTDTRMVPSFDGTRLYLCTDLPENCRAIVVICHGLGEYTGRFARLAAQLNMCGLGTYRYDHRGHGRSEGKRGFFSSYHELVDDAHAVFELAVKENPGKKVFVFGHSMGGLCASLFGVKYSGQAAGIIISAAPSHDMKGTMENLPEGLPPESIMPNAPGNSACSVKEIVAAAQSDPYILKEYTAGLRYALREGLHWAREHFDRFSDPVLILHGTQDYLVGYEDSIKLLEDVASEDKQLKLYGRIYHEIFNEPVRDEAARDVIGWILNRT